MRIPLKKVSYASIILLSLLAAAGVTALTTSHRPQEPQPSQAPQQPQEPRKVYLPKRFLSEVKNLKVESHWIEDEGTAVPILVVILRNKSHLAVTCASVTIADLTVTRDGGADFDEPFTVIEPYGTKKFSIPVSNFIDDSPLFISAALYADGTEEGREQQLRWIHKDREKGRAERAAKKGGPER